MDASIGLYYTYSIMIHPCGVNQKNLYFIISGSPSPYAENRVKNGWLHFLR